jgi:prepilin-type N-terminal cleavage/methylation domain-containing protein
MNARAPTAAASIHRGFTLVELMVVLVIIGLLSSLMLAGLARVRYRAKVDKTKSTIRKIHELIMPQYESYVRRRVPFATTNDARQNALNRLTAIRQLMAREMPDNWNDVFPSPSALAAAPTVPSYLKTGPVYTYATVKELLSSAPTFSANESAECLYLTAAHGGTEPYAMEQFRSDELGDTDGDSALEFLDGWNRPIIFLRWAPGFTVSSFVQVADAATRHDPFDPQRVDLSGYALVPLIVSAGPDGLTGLQVPANGWLALDLASIVANASHIGAPDPGAAGDSQDNITNHDFSVK